MNTTEYQIICRIMELCRKQRIIEDMVDTLHTKVRCYDPMIEELLWYEHEGLGKQIVSLERDPNLFDEEV